MKGVGALNRAGELITNLSGDASYKSFRPNALPPTPPVRVEGELFENLMAASRATASLDSVASRIPNVSLFVSMYVRKEALLSSQIEGTQCTLDDVFSSELTENVKCDVADVVNYIKATEYALRRMGELPLCMRLIRETHAVLMAGVRGDEKNPGEFRTSQNWIGGGGSTIKNARYIPPNVEDMADALSALEKFINEDASVDPFIAAALIHYQFETIHPFLDGNGRIGRLLITLYLKEKKILSTPAMYLSYFLKKNRIEYYDRMTEVRRTGNYEQWVSFFLLAVAEAARDAVENIDLLGALHDRNLSAIRSRGAGTKNLEKLFLYIEKNPIIDTAKTATELGVSYNTAAKAVASLCDLGILAATRKEARTKIFSYEEYLSILRKDT